MESHLEYFKVRDYECDIQGVVNNSVYQNYLEHARHECLHALKVDFVALAEAGINLVVTRVELNYKLSLRPGDEFHVATRLVRESKVRFAFLQDIVRKADNKVVLEGKVTGTALNARGRPEIPDVLEQALQEWERV